MSTVNKVILVGRLGRDPELRYTQGGKAVCNLNVATNESWTDKNGDKQEETEWHRITVWGATAEKCDKYLSKGRQVYVEGRIKTDKWQDDDGNDRYSTGIVATNVTFLSGGGTGGGGTNTNDPAPVTDDDEIPF